MLNEPLTMLALVLALLTLAFVLGRHPSPRREQMRWQLDNQLIRHCLDLLQAMQKHRGLGALHDAMGITQRHAVADELDQLWQDWPGADLQLPALHEQWPMLRRNPHDFDGHCRQIEALLEVLEQLEDRLYQRQHLDIRGLGEACRAQENLARLRGLAVRAAYHGRCPSGLRVQLEFLCSHLHIEDDESELPALLERLREDLIDAPQVRITPGECFALFTPLLERRLQRIRQKWS
ncbi:hypothetical protein [Pseudomonas sp. AA-38]|uniref:hypothetical protein n=1 Tax=Pseudomonas sp. AA-38 TaxID=3028807 RepID=UPI0023F7966A|nr:hypothetical protein [Pseudomonas sp. AA-38]